VAPRALVPAGLALAREPAVRAVLAQVVPVRAARVGALAVVGPVVAEAAVVAPDRRVRIPSIEEG
jgi:hypothetical protein